MHNVYTIFFLSHPVCFQYYTSKHQIRIDKSMQDILPKALNGTRLSRHDAHNPLTMMLTYLGIVIYTVLKNIIKNGQNVPAVVEFNDEKKYCETLVITVNIN